MSANKSFDLDRALFDYQKLTKSFVTPVKTDENQNPNADISLAPANVSFDLSKAIEESELSANKESKSLPITQNSSTESSDEEGLFHKFSGPNILKKLRGNKGSTSQSSVPATPTDETVDRNADKLNENGNPPTSPKPLVKAFGRLKNSSKGLAHNFKSYIAHRGNGNDDSSVKTSHTVSPLQKSASSGASINMFAQVVQDYGRFRIFLKFLMLM